MVTRRTRLDLETLEDRSVPAALVVDRLTDNASATGGQGTGLTGDLRYCISQANALAGSDTITFSVTGTINLLAALPTIMGDLVIDGDSSTVGAGSDASKIRVARSASASSDFGIFAVDNGNTGTSISANFYDLTVSGGRAGLGSGGGFLFTYNGVSGRIWDCVVEDNYSNGGGGAAVRAGAVLDIQDSLFQNNHDEGNSQARGAAIYNYGGTLNVSRSTLTGNATQFGAGVFTESNVNLVASTTLRNVTVDANSSYSGAVSNFSYVTAATTALIDCTITSNSTQGVDNEIYSGSGGSAYLTLQNNLFHGNPLGDITNNGSVTSYGGNVSDSNSGYLISTGDVNGATNIFLGPLRDNGGPVPTRALLPGSAGLDSGFAADSTDARGVARPPYAADAGAYEARTFYLSVASGNGQSAQAGSAYSSPLRAQLTEGGQPVQGAAITFTIDYGGATFQAGGTSYVAYTDASGYATSGTLVAWDTPGTYTITASTNGGQTTSFTTTVTNTAPTGLNVAFGGTSGGPGHASIPEGQTLTVNGSFTDPGDGRGHTVFVYWGDEGSDSGEGSESSFSASNSIRGPQVIYLDPGVTTFSATHVYTAAEGLPPSTPTSLDVDVYVDDASFGEARAQRSLTVTDNVPVVDAGHDEFFNQGEPFVRVGSFFYDGSNSFSGTVDYGDGTGLQQLVIRADDTFVLAHTYAQEGTYLVHVVVTDGRGQPGTAVFEADVLLPEVSDADKGYLGPQGGTVTVRATGVTGTLTTMGGRYSAIIVARVPDPVANAQGGGFVEVDTGVAIGGAFDVRTINVGPHDFAVVTFSYYNDNNDTPSLLFFDRTTGQERVIPPSAYTVDLQAHTITITFTSTSYVRLDELRGTVFTITVPIANPATATGFSASALEGQAASTLVTAATTGLSGGGGGSGPGGGSRSQSESQFVSDDDGSSAAEVEDKDADKPAVAPQKAAPATNGLPAAPPLSVDVPGVTLTAPQPRRLDLGPIPGPAPGNEEEEQEQHQESGWFFDLNEEAVGALWFQEEAEANVESRDEVFADLGESHTGEAAWLMLMPALAGPVLRKKRHQKAA